MKGFAISSAVEGVPITAEIATALLQNLRRLERLWVKQLTDPQEANARVWGCKAEVEMIWDAAIGAVNPADYARVQLVAALPEGTPTGVIAFHTNDSTGPICLISYVAAGSDWPSAMSHEICESRVDANCTASAKAPDGTTWDLEVCDSVEGSDYVEQGTNVRVSNAVGPRYFNLDTVGPCDIAGVVLPFEQLSTGYHVQDGAEVFGDAVSDAKRAHALSAHGRVGVRRGRR